MSDTDENKWFPVSKSFVEMYILGDVIARGEFSVVYKCLHKGKSERACKVYKKSQLDQKAVMAQLDELLTLSHPNLVSVRDIFETIYEMQLICDFVNGGELFDRIVETGNYNEVEAAKPIKEILTALNYLHTKGISHGNINPENILYDSFGPNAKLKLSNVPLRKLQHKPKLCYSAPELFELIPLTPSCDIWSIGIVLYILLSGIEPIFEEGKFETKFKDSLWDEVSSSAKSLISHCLVYDPKERLTAAEALKHPWICGSAANTLPLPSTQDRLRQFNARRKFKAATQAILAAQKAMNLISPQRKTATAR